MILQHAAQNISQLDIRERKRTRRHSPLTVTPTRRGHFCIGPIGATNPIGSINAISSTNPSGSINPASPTSPIEPATANHYELWWIQSGNATLHIDGIAHIARPDTIFCLTPGQERHLVPGQERLLAPSQERQLNSNPAALTGIYIRFSTDFLDMSALHRRSIPWLDPCMARMTRPATTIDNDTRKELDDLIVKMRREFNAHSLLRWELLSGMLNVLVIHLSRNMDRRDAGALYTKELQTADNFLGMVRAEYRKLKLVADYARALHISSSHLNRIIKRTTGFTASHHIQQQIIHTAKQQAIHSGFSMKEIAYQLGYDDLSYFSKFFKKNTGMSFSHFKRSSA